MRPRHKRLQPLLRALFVTCGLVYFFSGSAEARPARLRNVQTAAAPQSQFEDLLRQSGYDVKKVKANSWYIERIGKVHPRIRILIGSSPSSVAIGAVVASKRNLRLTADAYYKLMKLSYDLNYVRICIDTDDDLIVMAQRKGVWLNLQELKDTIEKVTAAADRAYGEMRLFITP